MAFDRADWHYGGDFPPKLPIENGGTHIGMFLAWAIMNGLEGEIHRESSVLSLEAVRKKVMTGREFLFKECDEKFWSEDLSEIGVEFATYYYESGIYYKDYEVALASECETLYHVDDSWRNYELIATVVDRRFHDWLVKRNRKWWQFWK